MADQAHKKLRATLLRDIAVNQLIQYFNACRDAGIDPAADLFAFLQEHYGFDGLEGIADVSMN